LYAPPCIDFGRIQTIWGQSVLGWVLILAAIGLATGSMVLLRPTRGDSATIARRFVFLALVFTAAILGLGIARQPSLSALQQVDAAVQAQPMAHVETLDCRDALSAAPLIERATDRRVTVGAQGEVRISASDWASVGEPQRKVLVSLSARIRGCKDRSDLGWAKIVDPETGDVLLSARTGEGAP
jgi:hypothetical protein